MINIGKSLINVVLSVDNSRYTFDVTNDKATVNVNGKELTVEPLYRDDKEEDQYSAFINAKDIAKVIPENYRELLGASENFYLHPCHEHSILTNHLNSIILDEIIKWYSDAK